MKKLTWNSGFLTFMYSICILRMAMTDRLEHELSEIGLVYYYEKCVKYASAKINSHLHVIIISSSSSAVADIECIPCTDRTP